MNRNLLDSRKIVKKRRRDDSVLKFDAISGGPKEPKTCFYFPSGVVDPLGWKPGFSSIAILPDNNTQQLSFFEDAEGYLLNFCDRAGARVRLTCPKDLELTLRHTLQIDPAKSTEVPLVLEINANSIVISFKAHKHPATTVSATPALEKIANPSGERMLKWFEYDHLQQPLKKVSSYFFVLAQDLCASCDPGPERTVALRKLLEAKDAAVRAKLHPGG